VKVEREGVGVLSESAENAEEVWWGPIIVENMYVLKKVHQYNTSICKKKRKS
jgi:hypothetical protein